MSNRFHNKFHRHNHHTEPTDRDGQFPDSAYDPIASPDSPFRGEFYIDGNITTLSSISAIGTATIETIPIGNTNDVIIKSIQNVIQTRIANPAIWDTTATFVSASDGALSINYLAKATNSNGINESIVYDDGSNVGVGTSNPNKELTVIGDISATGTIYANSIILSGKSLEDVVTTTTNITADIAAGAIDAGNIVPAGTSLQKFVEQLLLKTFYPTFTNPSASMSSSLGSTVESGTTGITLTVGLNKGAITGKSIGGIWQPATFQNFRSGAATNYIINGTNNGTNNSLAFPSIVIADGSNLFSSTTSYAQGPQPVDSKNANYSTPLVAGTVGASLTVTGARRGFYGVSSVANTSALIRSLGNSTNPGVANGTSFTINIPVGATSVVFAYPATLQNVTSVKYEQGLDAEVKANFVQTTVSVEGLNSYTAINYKVYRYVPVEPFPATATYRVTI